MSLNTYKLVPLEAFEELTKNDNNTKNTSGISPDTDNQSGRSINSIIEENQKYINPSNSSDTVVKYSTKVAPATISPNTLKGGASGPQWVYGDANVLPDFTLGKKVQDSFETYKDVLDDKTIPTRLKVLLLQYFKDKYDRTRLFGNNYNDDDNDDDDNDDIDYLNYGKKYSPAYNVLRLAPADKRRIMSEILKILNNNKNYIDWDIDGNFKRPKFVDTNILNLGVLLKTLTYAAYGTSNVIEEIVQVLRPLYKVLKPFIINRKIIAYFKDDKTYITPYKSFASPPTKKRKIV